MFYIMFLCDKYFFLIPTKLVGISYKDIVLKDTVGIVAEVDVE